MNEASLFHGPNAGYVFELYEQFLRDPESVDPQTRDFFSRWSPVEPSAKPSPNGAMDVDKIISAARWVRYIRELGHLAARIDPLGSPRPGDPGLDLSSHNLTKEDLLSLPASVVGGPLAENAPNAWEAAQQLLEAYTGSIGYEDDHIQVAEERTWLRRAAESRRYFEGITPEEKRALLARLTEVDTFERFLKQNFGTDKWFSIEGNDTLVPILDRIIHDAALSGTREVVMGMAHRGRLNVLAHILGKPYSAVFADFLSKKREEGAAVAGVGTHGYSGDVKYHLGASRLYVGGRVERISITLAPNPSHLEFVGPVVLGRARAAQDECEEPGAPRQDISACLPILIHGDASFPGQGIVAETLNLSQLPGYRVGGTIHVIVNNQIGFTTAPGEGRSTLYASDLAKGFEIPIVHVNADDPIACIAVARMAWEYRERFGKDFLIDLVGYRRHGHNEMDLPDFTQPRMYQQIRALPSVRQKFADQLAEEGIVTPEESEQMVAVVRKRLEEALLIPEEERTPQRNPSRAMDSADQVHAAYTAVPLERLSALNDAIHAVPAGFTVHDSLQKRFFAQRIAAFREGSGINWAHAEALAFASILADGVPIRLTGQDSERGTFGQRHLALHDPNTGQKYIPLQHLPQARAAFEVHNSPLSENAVVGFEYGFSMHATGALVLWEAQFGDFVNGAQVFIDQFLVSGYSKWRQTPALVLLLPHGYEGQGPEHSSARLERFLQLAANDNIRVVNTVDPGQYFHVLRRQAAMLHANPRPLILLTPKGALRDPRAATTVRELTEGYFKPVNDDPATAGTERARRVTRLVLCTGKIYLDLIKSEAYQTAERVAIVRIAELYPFPTDELRETLRGYPNVREVVWLQEEPRNMGAWNFVADRIRPLLERGMLRYMGRREAASPAEGSQRRHDVEQARIVSSALNGAPELAADHAPVIHAR